MTLRPGVNIPTKRAQAGDAAHRPVGTTMNTNMGTGKRRGRGRREEADERPSGAGIVVDESPEIERIELETTEPGPEQRVDFSYLEEQLELASDDELPRLYTDTDFDTGADDRPPPAADRQAARSDQDEDFRQLDDQLRIAAELASLRRSSAARERELRAELKAARDAIARREADIAAQTAQIASLTLECSGLRVQLEQGDGSLAVVAGSVGSHAGPESGDLVSRLKARLEESRLALRVAREEIEALSRECARLKGPRASAATARHAPAAPAEEGLGNRFRQLLARIRARGDAPAAEDDFTGEPGTEVPTVVITGKATVSSGTGIVVSEGYLDDDEPRGRADGDAAPRPADPAPAASTSLRRYVIALDPESSVVHELARTRSYVGRGAEADLCLTDVTVSRLHAILSLDDGATVVEDASSTNGVYVNGHRVRRAALKDGDTVTFGSVRFQYRTGPAGSG
jgi:hypothetical protein